MNFREFDYKSPDDIKMELKKVGGRMKCSAEWKSVRPMPSRDNWFENVWSNYRNNKIIF